MKILGLKYIKENYGDLTVLESSQIPFQIKRVYWLTNNNYNQERGCHAHKSLKQIFLTIQGSARILLKYKNGENQEINMTETSGALYLENCIWKEILPTSNDYICCVLADQDYNEEDYIRSLEEYYSYDE